MFRAMGAAADDGEWRRSAERWFGDRIDDPQVCLVVVEVDGRVVASAVGLRRDTLPSPGNAGGGDIHVNNVCTFPAERGRGYAAAALAEVMRWARASGVGRAELMATADGRSLYEREGFKVHDYPAMRARLQADS